MKQSPSLWFVLCLVVTLSSFAFYQYDLKQDVEPGSDKIAFCKTRPNPKHHGPNLISTSSSSSSKDLILCPGDTFGDLNDTYVEVKNCYLALYHKGNMIWSSKMDQSHRAKMQKSEKICAFSLQRDGNLALYKEGIILVNPGGARQVIFDLWDSQTNFHPAKTELTVQGQKVKVIQTFKDGTERLFYADEENQEFKENLGAPRKVADKEIIINHTQKESIILQRNEYIGDLRSTYLILQEDCKVQLLNKNTIIWSFIPPFRHEMSCILSTGGFMNSVMISKKIDATSQDSRKITRGDEFLHVVQTKITFDDNQPIIIQTLKNGSQLILSSGSGKNIGLKSKREPRQIAEKTLEIPKNASSDFKLERMDYIGNLTGLHLILEQNCSLILRSANQKLWEFHTNSHDDPLMDCSLEFRRDRSILMRREWSTFFGGGYHLLITDYLVSGYQLTLENNGMIITCQRTDGAPDLYYADQRTRGLLLRALAEHSVEIHYDDRENRTLPKRSYIGDLNGVHALFEVNCNWVLYNKTKVIWESGTFLDDYLDQCELVLKRDGTMKIVTRLFSEDPPVWSSSNLPDGKVLKTEVTVTVNDDGLWLINTFDDGTFLKYKAMEDTNNFDLLSEKRKDKFILNQDL